MKFLTAAAVALMVAVQWPTTAKATMVWDEDSLVLVELGACALAAEEGTLMRIDRGENAEVRWFLWGQYLYSQRLMRTGGKIIAQCGERRAESP